MGGVVVGSWLHPAHGFALGHISVKLMPPAFPLRRFICSERLIKSGIVVAPPKFICIHQLLLMWAASMAAVALNMGTRLDLCMVAMPMQSVPV